MLFLVSHSWKEAKKCLLLPGLNSFYRMSIHGEEASDPMAADDQSSLIPVYTWNLSTLHISFPIISLVKRNHDSSEASPFINFLVKNNLPPSKSFVLLFPSPWIVSVLPKTSEVPADRNLERTEWKWELRCTDAVGKTVTSFLWTPSSWEGCGSQYVKCWGPQYIKQCHLGSYV